MSRQEDIEQAGGRRTGRGAGREQVRGIEQAGVSRAASRVAVGSRVGRGRRADRGQAGPGGRTYCRAGRRA